jgi:hypothetical protein
MAEVAATRISRPIGWLLFVGFLVLVASGPVAELAAGLWRSGSVWSDPWPSAGEEANALAVSRLAIAEIGRRGDQETALVRAVRPWGQLALTALLRYGNEKAYVGRDGWLVYREDFDHLTTRSYLERRRRADLRVDSRAVPVGAIAAFAAELERRGLALLLCQPAGSRCTRRAWRRATGQAPRNPPTSTGGLGRPVPPARPHRAAPS